MKPQTFLILFSFTLLALALVPLTAAQEGNMLTDSLAWLTDGAGNLWSQASTFVAEQPEATGAITTLGAGTGIGAVGWKVASKGKKTAEDLASDLSKRVSGAESQASTAVEQLTSYKTTTETQLSELKTQAETATSQINKVKADAQLEIGKYSTQLEEVNKQKANLQLSNEDLKTQLKTAQDKLAGALAAAQKVI